MDAMFSEATGAEEAVRTRTYPRARALPERLGSLSRPPAEMLGAITTLISEINTRIAALLEKVASKFTEVFSVCCKYARMRTLVGRPLLTGQRSSPSCDR